MNHITRRNLMFFLDFLKLFLPEVAAYIDPASITFITTEMFSDLVTGELYRADVLVRARFKPSAGLGKEAYFIIHVEPQSTSKQDFPWRMFRYITVLHGQTRLPIYPVALLTYDSPLADAIDHYSIEFPDRTVLKCAWCVIQLNRLNWRDFLRHHNAVAVALMAKMKIAPADRPKVKTECLRLLATLKLDPARTKLIRGFLDAYLRLNTEEIMEYNREVQALEPKQRKAVMQLVNEWEEIGEARGEARGERRGRMETLVEQLQDRFGKLPAKTRKRLEVLNLDQLKSLTVAIGRMDDTAALNQWLNRVAPK